MSNFNLYANDLYYLWFAIPVFAILLVVLIAFIIVNKRKDKNKIPNNSAGEEKKIQSDAVVVNDEIIEYLGGADNILRLELKGNSRLFIKINDFKVINKEEIKKLNIRILEMSDKIVLVNENIKPIYDKLNSLKLN